MKIYHYTNIEALALILKNQTIRFNRLDKVDDIEEGKAESWGVKFCKYVFVSCWTVMIDLTKLKTDFLQSSSDNSVPASYLSHFTEPPVQI